MAKNQTLTVGVATLQQQYVDPVLANEGGHLYPVKWSIGEPLARQQQDLTYVPALATEWSVADDGLTWTVTLREGVKMHDGSDFTATDVKTSIDRVMNPDFGADFTSYAAYAGKIDTVTVVDDLALEIKTTIPYANVVADTPAPVATAYYEEVGEEKFREAPIAAGPYKFESSEFNNAITMTRFDDFWDADRIPNFKTLVLKLVPDESSRVSGLVSGQLDVAYSLSPNSATQLEGSNGVEIRRVPQIGIQYALFNDLYTGDDTPLTDKNVRLALLMAIDREAIADGLYQGFGKIPALTPAADGSEREPVAYDPDGAKQMLEEAGASDLSLTFHTSMDSGTAPELVKLVEAVAGYWEDIGVKVEVEAEETPTYLEKYTGHQFTGVTTLGNPTSLVADPAKLSLYFSSTGAYSAVKDPKLDAMFDKLGGTLDQDEYQEVGNEIRRYIEDNVYGAPMAALDGIIGIGPNVASFDLLDGNPYPGPFWYLRAR